MASSLLLLLDDIASVLDDVSVMTKVAAKKTAGVLGDDLALNAKQVAGIAAERELPVVWRVAFGSLINKSLLVPAALLLNWLLPVAVTPLLMAGGLFLCFEGAEKLLHRLLYPKEASGHDTVVKAAAAASSADLLAAEQTRILGAIRTDFILSAEIIVITLGVVAERTFAVQLGVLVAISILMTVGVYGLVAGIVKLDDLGLWLARQQPGAAQAIGRGIMTTAPWLMRLLSVAGTTAMFLVGGGIVLHGIPPLHHFAEETLPHNLPGLEPFALITANGVFGLVAGCIVLAVVQTGRAVLSRTS